MDGFAQLKGNLASRYVETVLLWVHKPVMIITQQMEMAVVLLVVYKVDIIVLWDQIVKDVYLIVFLAILQQIAISVIPFLCGMDQLVLPIVQ